MHRPSLVTALLWATVLFVPASGGAQQRPLETQDPEPLGNGRLLVDGGMFYDWNVFLPISGLRGDRTILRGGFSVGFGDLTEVQFYGGFQQMQIAAREPAPFSDLIQVPGDTTKDSDDVTIAVKIKFLSESPNRPGMAFRFETRLPNASNESGLGQDTTNFMTQVIVGKRAGRLRLVGNVGYLIQDDATALARQDDILTFSGSASYAFSRSGEVLAEYVGRHNGANYIAPDAEDRGVIRVGARYTAGNVRADAAYTIGRLGYEPDHGVTFGVSFVTQAFRLP